MVRERLPSDDHDVPRQVWNLLNIEERLRGEVLGTSLVVRVGMTHRGCR